MLIAFCFLLVFFDFFLHQPSSRHATHDGALGILLGGVRIFYGANILTEKQREIKHNLPVFLRK